MPNCQCVVHTKLGLPQANVVAVVMMGKPPPPFASRLMGGREPKRIDNEVTKSIDENFI